MQHNPKPRAQLSLSPTMRSPIPNNVNITIRPAETRDAPGIIAVLNPIIRAGGLTIMEHEITLDEQIAFMRGFPTSGVFLVAVDRLDDRILALQSVEPVVAGDWASALSHVGEISTFVDLDARRTGIGRQLTDATVRVCANLGILKLTAMIRADNPAAQGFYRSCNFQPIGTARRHARVQGAFIDEIMMERWIGA